VSGSYPRRPRRLANPIGLLVLSLAIACRTASQPLTPEPLPVDAQCFAVTYQPEQTPVLPATVALTRLGVATDSARAYWRNSPEDTAQYGPMLYGTWRWLGTGRDSVVVRFTSGFSGANLVLGVERTASGAIELRGGRAWPFSDVLTRGGPAESRATVRRESCLLAQIPQRSPELLRRADSLAALDPAREVQLALERRDHRFIGVCGYACFAPSPEGPVNVSNNELRVIEGTSDSPLNQDEERLNEVADAYATKYNQLLLAALGRKATKRPPT
jgi:hypothetical protein